MVFNQWLAPASIKQNPAFMPEAVPLITFIPSGCSHRRPWIWERIWLNLLCGRRRSQLSLVKVPIIWKVANCLENRKDFKDLINLKSLLFIARLNSNQFVGTQRVCDDSVRCVCVWELQKQSVDKTISWKTKCRVVRCSKVQSQSYTRSRDKSADIELKGRLKHSNR